MDSETKNFLTRYAYIMLLDTKSETISDALYQIVSDSRVLNGYHNLYGLDMRNIYWEWELEPNDSEDKLQINRITVAQLVILSQYDRTTDFTKYL